MTASGGLVAAPGLVRAGQDGRAHRGPAGGAAEADGRRGRARDAELLGRRQGQDGRADLRPEQLERGVQARRGLLHLTLWDKNWRIRIQSIERVQNVSLWQSYRVKRSTICSREHDEKAALHKYVRCWVFHGRPSDIASKVIQQGFNRSYTSNGKVYGRGVYFARDASYS